MGTRGGQEITLPAHTRATSNQPLALVRTNNNADEIVVDWSNRVVDSNVNSSSDECVDRIVGKSRGELREKSHPDNLLGTYPPIVGPIKLPSDFPPHQPKRERESSWLGPGMDT